MLLFSVIIYVLPKQLPLFLAVMSLPPYDDHMNLLCLYTVIEEQAATATVFIAELKDSHP